MGEGLDAFQFKFDNKTPKKKPSQEKRDFERRNEFLKKVKVENKSSDEKLIEPTVKVDRETMEQKKVKKVKFEIAAHMGSAAESVLKSAVSQHFSRSLSDKIKWDRSQSKWDLQEKIDGIFGGVHEFEMIIDLDDETKIDEKLKQLKQNWKKGQFPTKLMNMWMEDQK